MTEKTDPLAENHARNALADMLYHSNVDLSEDGCGDPEDNADHLAGLVTDAHVVTWERQVNIDPGHGPTRGTPGDPNVYVRRYVLRGAWEVDPEGERYFDEIERQLKEVRALVDKSSFGTAVKCSDPECPDFGDPSFGEGTCPADHVFTPEQHGVIADELAAARREGYVEALRKVRDHDTVSWMPEDLGNEVARQMGVTL